MRVRAYQPPDAPVRVVYPNQRLRAPGESEDAFLDRICAHTIEADPTLRGLPSADMDHTELPTERTRPSLDLQRASVDVRRAWRVVGKRVVIDKTKV